MNKTCVMYFAATLLLTFLVTIKSEPIESNFYREEPCSAKQGFCVLENECPSSGTDEEFRDLCPDQKAKGAICCKNLSHENVNCAQLHNECREKCPSYLTMGRKGCPENSVCCVLIS